MTRKELKKIIHYDPEAGIFTWVNNSGRHGRILAGSVAGSINKNDGYARICISKKFYFAHRLAFLYVFGRFPKECVDHINRIKSDNRWENLREATKAENNRNTPKRKHNTSGYKGVTWAKKEGKWKAQISYKGKNNHIGYFSSVNSAAIAYIKSSKKIHRNFSGV